MFLFSLNFNIFYAAFFKKSKKFFKSEELKVAIAINDFLEAFTAVATTYNGLGQFGEAQSFYELRDASKFVLSIAMLLGRLEIYPLLLLLTPSTYKRR